jgi:prepilin-type N-terminal cleavage/methylation domain-containing protein
MRTKSRQSLRSRNHGFTLIEVMVALAILAGLTLLTSQAMKSAVDNRVSLAADISRDAKLADALRVIRSDVASAFHYRDIHVTMYNEMIKAAQQQQMQDQQQQQPQQQPSPQQPGGAPGGQQQPLPPLGTPRPIPPQVTHFVGDSDSMYFTALSNVRTIRDSQESDQAEIGYFIKSCRSGSQRQQVTSSCLFRSVTPYLDEDVSAGGKETMLVDHIEEFKLRYIGPGQDEFVESWKTGGSGDAVTKSNFPYAVEVTLTIHNKSDRRDKPATQTILAPLRFPNNPPKKKQQQGNQGEPQPGGE